MMRKIQLAAAAVLIAFTMGGCAQLDMVRQTWDAAKSSVVSKNGVVLAVNLFHAAERTATVYVSQKHCPVGIQKPTCMSPPIRETIAPILAEGQRTRDALIKFAQDHPGEIGDQGLYDALKATTAALRGIFKAYNLGPKSGQAATS